MMLKRSMVAALVILSICLFSAYSAWGIPRPIVSQGVPVTENFNTLATSGTMNTLILPGWSLAESGGGARDNEQYAADNGASNTGDVYSYGSTGSTERALGMLRSGTLVPTIGAEFANGTGATINALEISYTGEQWRLGTTGRSDRIDFQFSMDANSLGTGIWADHDPLDFSSPVTTGTPGALDGNSAANRLMLTSTITGLNISPGDLFWIRWMDLDAAFSDDGLAVDDFSLTASGNAAPVPEPDAFMLMMAGLGVLAFLARRKEIPKGIQ
jgi:hypothetical protein